jgi:hypothetical protein
MTVGTYHPNIVQSVENIDIKYKPQVNILLEQTAPSFSSTEGQKHSYHVNTTSSCTCQLIMHFSGITLETKTMSTTISVDSFEHSVAVS